MMSVLINWCWCHRSNWGDHYDGRVIVSINRIPEGKTYNDSPTSDWTNLIEKVKLEWKSFGDPYYTYRLKPEVMDWLSKEIPDRRITKSETNSKGWAVGTDEYNSFDSGVHFNVFFHSYRQASRFIKRWSSIGKPYEYLNYFTHRRLKYNPTTKTVRKVK